MTTTLDKVNPGQTAKITQIKAGKGLHNRLNHMGIHVGDTVMVKRQLGGPIIISLHNTELAIGRGIAKKIIVSMNPE